MGYFEYLVVTVAPYYELRDIYQKLFYSLYNYDFEWVVKNDDNLIEEGLDLRDHYERASGEDCDKYGNCSVLEMLVSLAINCETQLMYDPDEGDRTADWFWMMIENLGLDRLTNDNFDYNSFEKIMHRFIFREYDKDGYGGPFYIHNFKGDMRKIELWDQLNYYLEEEFPI